MVVLPHLKKILMAKLFTPHPSIPRSPFGSRSTAEEVTAGIDLQGKVAVVTGCNSGLGYETMRVLALRGAHVIGTGRTEEKARQSGESIKGKMTPIALELSDLSSVVAAANAIKALGLPIDMLICNAGTSTFGEQWYHGIEDMFVINYLSHFVLVHHLLPSVKAAEAGRIVHVSSRASHSIAPKGGIDFDHLREGTKQGGGLERYGRSKLANALFSLELSKRLVGTGVTSNALHPGLVKTEIVRHTPGLFQLLFHSIGRLFSKNLAQGAATQVFLAAHPLVAGVSGAYFQDCNAVKVRQPHHLEDEALAAELWEVSEDLVGEWL